MTNIVLPISVQKIRLSDPDQAEEGYKKIFNVVTTQLDDNLMSELAAVVRQCDQIKGEYRSSAIVTTGHDILEMWRDTKGLLLNTRPVSVCGRL